jgi:hypothetical protein
MLRRLSVLFASMYLLAATASGQANGKLQIHHIDVGQGDGAVLISPAGQVVVFDAGEDMKKRDCTRADFVPRPAWGETHRLPLRQPLPFRPHRLYSCCAWAICPN